MNFPETTEDALLGGRVRFRQPVSGYRAAIDPVLLAAAAGETARAALDLGCGAGAASLALMARVPGVAVTGIEIDPGLAALARDNARANGWAERFSAETGDVAASTRSGFDLVLANPPYLEAAASDPSPDPAKRRADVEGDPPLAGWVAAALKAAARGGTLLFIHRADRLADLLSAFGSEAGETVVFPLWPRTGVPAKRVIVRARKGIRTRLALAPGLVLHASDGNYAPETEAILRDGAPLRLL